MNLRLRFVLIAVLVGSTGVPVSLAESLEEILRKRIQALEAMIQQGDEDSIHRFLDGHIADDLKQSQGARSLKELLGDIREACASAGGIVATRDGETGMRLVFEGRDENQLVFFRLDSFPPYRVVELSWEALPRPDREKPPWLEGLTWENLEQTLQQAEQHGFSGTVLVVREDRLVLHEGYGVADRDQDIACTLNTVYAIGSTPIDFTHAAILKLRDLGLLTRSDPITRFFEKVPSDKQAITVDHLMTGKSGLPNFHHQAGVDEDPDLTWIDRETAARRILGSRLLFVPGEGNEHSHSAWGLLAAIVEIVSGETYIDFLRRHFFEPAGMASTGLYEEAKDFGVGRLAVGYGMQKPTQINTPAHWGQTSWLVMGSGGMVSTTGDLYRWDSAIRSGNLLSDRSRQEYRLGGLSVGGNDRGFLCVLATRGESGVYLCSNSHVSTHDLARDVGDALADLVLK